MNMTLSDALSYYIKRIKKEDFNLFCIFVVIFMLLYGAMVTRYGYVVDELYVYNSSDTAWYRALGRWGIALWRWIFGETPHPVAQCMTSALLLSISLVVLVNAINLKGQINRIIFGWIYLIQFQFAYVMGFSFQSDVAAFGLLCISAASYTLQQKGHRYLFISLILLVFSLAVYQSLIFNFTIIVLFLLYRSIIGQSTQTTYKVLLRFVVCCSMAIPLYFLSWKLSTIIVYTSADTLNAGTEYRENFNVWAKIGFENIKAILGQLLYTFVEYAKNLIIPKEYPGEWIYSTAIIPLSWLIISTSCSRKPLIMKMSLILILLSIWGLPFTLMLVFGNPDAIGAHNRLGEPLSLACIWILAVYSIHWTPRMSIIFFTCLILLSIKASNYVNEMANDMRCKFESRLASYKQMEFDAVKLAASEKIDINQNNILLFRHNGKTYDLLDPMHNYPAILFVDASHNRDLLSDFYDKLESMNSWPNPNSICVHKGKVIIKCSYASYIKPTN